MLEMMAYVADFVWGLIPAKAERYLIVRIFEYLCLAVVIVYLVDLVFPFMLPWLLGVLGFTPP